MNVRATALSLVTAALAALEAERAVINDLNVYPVPDGDTGTNLVLTVQAVKEELENARAEDLAGAAAAIAKGSLMGARGNSGVILSQIVRGVCEVCGAAQQLGADELRRALAEGSTCAYRAVKQPVEGTMLTVIREMAAAAQDVGPGARLEDVFKHVIEAGRVAVERTIDQLAVLRQAGVVDAGGYGLLVLLRGVAAGVLHEPAATEPAATAAGVVPAAAVAAPSELSRYRYCTSLLIAGEGIDCDEFERFLLPIGDSALLVGDEHMIKVHVHTDDPGTVLTHAVQLGVVSDVEINDMHKQTRDRDSRLSAGSQATVVVAVVAGDGNKELFRELGCAAIVDGGQSMNPSAAQILAAVDDLGADDIVVLPNNGNVVLTAEQAAGMSDRTIAVVPSTSIPAGLAAMVAFESDLDAGENQTTMTAALDGVRSAEITTAVRDSDVDGVTVRQGEVIGLVDGHIVAAAEELREVFEKVVEAFATGDPEVITVLTALNGSSLGDDDLAAIVRRRCPQAEISIHRGGQPLYPILASAE